MSFFRSETIEARDARAMPDLLTRLREEEFDALIVKQVYDKESCDGIVRRLESDCHRLVRTDFPAKFRAYFLGVNLNLAHPELSAYFAEAPRFHKGLALVFPDDLDLRSRVLGLMSSLDQGLDYGPPPGPSTGSVHMFTTIRAHLKGGYIPAHFDDEQVARPSYRYVLPLIRMKLFSFVQAFSQAEEGGALEVFDLAPVEPGQLIAMDGRSAPLPDLSGVEKISIRLPPGDLIVFNSGRRLHRVTPVLGDVTRWTACSFMAPSKVGDRVYCWG